MDGPEVDDCLQNAEYVEITFSDPPESPEPPREPLTPLGVLAGIAVSFGCLLVVAGMLGAAVAMFWGTLRFFLN